MMFPIQEGSPMVRLINLISTVIVLLVSCSGIIWIFILVVQSLAASGSVGLFFGIVLVALTTGAIALVVNETYCTICRRFFLLRYSFKTLVEPTLYSEGQRHVTVHCSRCSYRREYEEVIRKISDIEPP